MDILRVADGYAFYALRNGNFNFIFAAQVPNGEIEFFIRLKTRRDRFLRKVREPERKIRYGTLFVVRYRLKIRYAFFSSSFCLSVNLLTSDAKCIRPNNEFIIFTTTFSSSGNSLLIVSTG